MKRLFEILFGRLTRGKKALAAASLLMLLMLTVPSLAYYMPFNTSSSGNIGLGTTASQTKFSIVGGNVGVGTWTAATASLETTGLRLIGNGAAAGSVLVSDTTGIGTWMAPGTLPAAAGPWTSGTGTVYNTTGSDKVGIGTTTPQGGLVVTNGNVGIGTWVAGAVLDVAGSIRTKGVYSSTYTYFNAGYGNTVSASTDNMVLGFSNIISGSNRYSTIIGQNNNNASGFNNNVLGEANTVSGNYGYIFGSGIKNYISYSVMIGPNDQSKITILNTGNIGIGTISPVSKISLVGNIGIGTGINSSFVRTSVPIGGMIVEGNVGMGTTTPQDKLIVVGGNVGVGTWTAATASLETTGLRLIGNGAAAGSVLVSDTTGIGTWMAASTLATSGGGTPGGSSSQLQYNNGGSFDGIVNSNVNASGNVGLGSTLSKNKLDVSGSVGIGSTYAGYYGVNSNGLIVQGNVGIGTFAPTAAMQVSSGAVKVVNGNHTITINPNATTSAGFNITGGTGHLFETILSTSGNTDLELWQNGTEKIRMDSSNEVLIGSQSGVNVGIGVSAGSVGAKLDVSGTTRMTSLLMTGNIGVGTVTASNALALVGGIGIGTGINTAYMTTAAPSGGVIVQGNVGIGTFSPVNQLDVSGIPSAVSGAQIGATDTTAMTTEVGGGIRFSGFYNATAQATFGSVRGYKMNSTSDNYAGGLRFLTRVDGSGSVSERMRIDSAGNVGIGTTTTQGALVVTNGNVGIGTWTAANASLETTGLRLIGNGAAAGSVLVSGSTGIGTWMAASTLATSGGGTPGGGSSQLQYNNGGSFDGIVNSNVDASGNVGLGTSLSMNKLDVSGGVGIGTSYAGYASAPANGLIVQGNVGFGSTTPQASLAILGNVGIGTISPSWAGQVLLQQQDTNTHILILRPVTNGASGYPIRVIRPSDNAAVFSVSSAGALTTNTVSATSVSLSGSWGTFSPATNYTYISTPYHFVVTPGAGYNVGIGTTTPQTRLAVLGGNLGIGTWTADNARLETDGFRLMNNGAAAGRVLVSGATGIGTWMAASTLATSGGASGWSTGTGTVYTTTGSDNVGLGTTTPQGAFVVTNGNVGIGTWTAATANLEVFGSANPQIAVSGANAGFQLIGTGGRTFAVASTSAASAPGAGYLSFLDMTAGAYRMVLGPNGNLGLGTVTPSGGLAVMNGNVGVGTWVPGSTMQVRNSFTFFSEYDNGNSGTSLTINWNNGNKQKVTLTGNCTFTFTAPTSGVSNYTLRLIQDGTGSRTVTWPASVKWSGGAPTLTTTAAAEDIVSCYYNGTNYYCSAALNFL